MDVEIWIITISNFVLGSEASLHSWTSSAPLLVAPYFNFSSKNISVLYSLTWDKNGCVTRKNFCTYLQLKLPNWEIMSMMKKADDGSAWICHRTFRRGQIEWLLTFLELKKKTLEMETAPGKSFDFFVSLCKQGYVLMSNGSDILECPKN